MRLSGFLASLAALAFASAIILPSVAEAQNRRAPSRITVTPRSYLVPGTEYPGRRAEDYAVDLRFRSGAPTAREMGPGGGGGLVNLPQPFELPGLRPLPF